MSSIRLPAIRAWRSVLVHAFAKADIPVLQLSNNANKPIEFHLDLGTRLAPLRERGVLIVGSGNHNLRPSSGRDQRQLSNGHVVSTRRRARSSPAIRAESASCRATLVLVDGYAFGSISMTCFMLDADCPKNGADERPW